MSSRRNLLLIIFSILILTCCEGERGSQSTPIEMQDVSELPWKAQWINAADQTDTVNTWTAYRREFTIGSWTGKPAHVRIAADSRYWMWINGQMVVREGGLKRGPNPEDTYFDVIEVEEFLRSGENCVAILVQYFGKHGFSHKSSGRSGMVFELLSEGWNIYSDSSWSAWIHPAFGETEPPHPNFRLPESNIFFDATKGDLTFTLPDYEGSKRPAMEAGSPPVAPWNRLIKRPIPLWKDFGLKEYEDIPELPFISTGDTLKLALPYNAQVTPYLKIRAEKGQKIDIRTDHYYGGGTPNIRGEYITREGEQEYELFGWINGHHVHYHIPVGIEILDLKYRETGYDTDFEGEFSCDDPFFIALWNKALRTLYITLRDTYMDCPDRERAQWWGDVVLESGESFYALDRQGDALTMKGILELMNWQRPDSTIYSPVPAGNWDQELPGQKLASVGYYGFYNYYLHTGDLETIRKVYEPVKKYLSVWKLNNHGTAEVRQGGWIWGDWGENKDIELILNTQYQLALMGLHGMAKALGKSTEAAEIAGKMADFKLAFNNFYWNGDHYRSPGYKGRPDDRSQALAVVARLADEAKYEAVYKVLQQEWHASPYMEKYVCEALFQMNYPEYALARLKERFTPMVTHPTITTLWEGWGIGAEGYGGGTINHAWSGGGLTLLAQYAAGISPASDGYDTIHIKPQPGLLQKIECVVPSIKGEITVAIDLSRENYYLKIQVPENVYTLVFVPATVENLYHNGLKVNTGEGSVQKIDGWWRVGISGGGKHIFEEK